ncbi:SH3 domain-containing protein [Streptococcus plurextorum]|uniref:SH3 domain-containing protein n=1 Tax=Streptococcus plurextorum TaxID=456876 RepID=UPI00040D04D6|nr:SH3 domain-containing protein [Streptococcus plurextorum]
MQKTMPGVLIGKSTFKIASLMLGMCLIGGVVATHDNGIFSPTTVSADTLSYARGDDYPDYLKYARADSVVDPWRLWNRECTSFVAHRLSSVNGFELPPAYGNAEEWGNRAKNEGYVVNHIPAVGAVAWWSNNHVAWVSAVLGDSVEIEEYNFHNPYPHLYNKRVIKSNQVSGFIHFKDLGDVTSFSQSNHLSTNLASRGHYTFTQPGIVRNEPKPSSPEMARYSIGQSVYYDQVVEENGYRWLSYLSYSGHRRYVAVEALPATHSPNMTGNLAITNQNDAQGTFDVVISGVRYSDLNTVQVPIWSDHNGQDDLTWYLARKESDGSYKVTVSIANHQNNRGLYHIHLYYQSLSGHLNFVEGGAKTIKISETSKQTLPASGRFTFTQASAVRNAPSMSSQSIAVYGAGQSVYYDSIFVAEGKQWLSYISYSGIRRYVAVN